MTFGDCKIIIAPDAAGNWQLATGCWQIFARRELYYQNKVEFGNQLVTDN